MEAGTKKLNDTVSALKGSTTEESLNSFPVALQRLRKVWNLLAGMTKAQTGMEYAFRSHDSGCVSCTGQIVPGLNSAASALTDASTMLSSKAEGLGTAFGGMKAQISAVSSAMDNTDRQQLQHLMTQTEELIPHSRL